MSLYTPSYLCEQKHNNTKVLLRAAKQAELKDVVADHPLLVVDDYVRGAILDPVMGFCTSKSFSNYQKIPDYASNEIRKLLKLNVFCEARYRVYEIGNYLALFDRKTGVTLARCDRYPMEGCVGVKLIATKNWKKGEILDLHNFSTTVATLWPGTNDYSATISLKDERKEEQRLWLGPCAIANHWCKNANAAYKTLARDKTLIEVRKDIAIGEEIFVNYGDDYFGTECECLECKAPAILPDITETPKTAGREKRSSTRNVVYNPEENAMEVQKKIEDRKKTYLIYKEMFDGVPYPVEKQAQMEIEEAEYAKKIGVLTKFDFSQEEKNVDSPQSNGYIFPKLQGYERDAVDSLMKISSEVELALKHQSSPNNTLPTDQQLPILSALQNIAMFSLPALKNFQEGMLKQKNVDLRHKANCEAKDIERKRIIKEHGMVEIECKLLDKYTKAIQEHLQAPTTPVDTDDDQEPDIVPIPTPGSKRRRNRRNDSVQKKRTRKSEAVSESPAKQIPGLPTCPETFLTTFNTIVLSRPRQPQQTLIPPRQLPRTGMQRLDSAPLQFINFKVTDSLRPTELISITAGLSNGKGTVTFDTPIVGINNEDTASKLSDIRDAVHVMAVSLSDQSMEMLADHGN